MSSTAWERVGAFSGVLFVVLYSTAFFGLQDLDFPPAGSVSAEQIRSFIDNERLRIALATISYTAGWAAFLWFIASIRSPGTVSDGVRRLEWVAAGAGILVAGLSLAGVGLQAEIVLADPTTNEATILSQWALFDASGGLSGVTPFFRAIFVGAISLVAIREGGWWRWLGWFGMGVMAANILGGIDFVIPANWSLTGHPLFDLLAFLAWILLASVVLLIKRPEPSKA